MDEQQRRLVEELLFAGPKKPSLPDALLWTFR